MPILLPTRDRLENLKRFIDAYTRTKASEKVVVLLDEDDHLKHDYLAFSRGNFPDHWEMVINNDRSKGIPYYINSYFNKRPNEEYYAVLADDVVPETEYWDEILKEACLPDKIAWADDSIQGESLPTHPFIGGDLVRKLGWISHPNLKHWYVDNVWKDIANLGKGVYLSSIKLTHHHWANQKAQMDDTYRTVPNPAVDQEVYRAIRNGGLRDLKEALA